MEKRMSKIESTHPSLMKIVISSRTEEESQIMRKRVEPILREVNAVRGDRSGAWIQFASIRPQALSMSYEPGKMLLIYNVNELQSSIDINEILKLRRAGFTGTALIVTKKPVEMAQREILSAQPTVFMTKPFENRDFLTLARKVLISENFESQKFPRYTTQENAQLRFENAPDNRCISRVINLSMGGAFLAFDKVPAARIGEFVHLTMELKQVNRTWVMPAKVVWVTQRGPNGQPGMGVEFSGQGDMKKNLLTI
jgi:hypothetical protein